MEAEMMMAEAMMMTTIMMEKVGEVEGPSPAWGIGGGKATAVAAPGTVKNGGGGVSIRPNARGIKRRKTKYQCSIFKDIEKGIAARLGAGI